MWVYSSMLDFFLNERLLVLYINQCTHRQGIFGILSSMLPQRKHLQPYLPRRVSNVYVHMTKPKSMSSKKHIFSNKNTILSYHVFLMVFPTRSYVPLYGVCIRCGFSKYFWMKVPICMLRKLNAFWTCSPNSRSKINSASM